jgi:hypothetical protein
MDFTFLANIINFMTRKNIGYVKTNKTYIKLIFYFEILLFKKGACIDQSV